MERKSGVLLHISSLWGKYSCGSFGRAGREFVDFLKASGFSYWQVLPFCLPNEFASPYKSYSAFSVNPNFIDLDILCENGLLTPGEVADAEQRTPWKCEFERLDRERFKLLTRAASRFTDEEAVDRFFRAHGHSEKFCHFMALRETNGGEPFWFWKSDREDASVYRTWRFIIFEFVRQWTELKAYANENGVSVIGDIPIYVAPDSSDVWESPDEFMLDEEKRPLRVAGVPPDYFCEDGQLWGNPLYNWEHMKSNGYRWWKERMRFMCELFDCIRIDHFRGLESFYSCPADAVNARHGRWEKGPGLEFVNVLKSVCGEHKQLIAEDLGEMTPQVKELVSASGFPGMRVMEFGFSDDPENTHTPYNYEKNVVAYTGTHDNNTLLGFLWEADEETRRRILAYCGFTGEHWDCKEAYYSVIRMMMGTVADTVVFPLQDLLMFGADTRMNTPGVEAGCWEWRVTREQLFGLDREELMAMNRLYARKNDPKQEKKEHSSAKEE